MTSDLIKIFSEKNDNEVLPAAAAEDNDENDEDTESTSRHTNDDTQLLRVWDQIRGRGEGEGDIPLCHPTSVDGHTGVLAQVTAAH